MAFDPDAFLAEQETEPDPLPAAPDAPAAPAGYSLPFGDDDFKSKRKRSEQFDSYIDLFAKDHPDLPDLADLTRAALMRESGGRTNAVSSSGAVGLMQMMPGTYADMGGESDPFNAIENIDKGMAYLAQQYRKFGTPELALAAYNAGPGNVRKHKGIPPFPETKEYVNAAMGYYQAIRGGATAAEAEEQTGFDPDAFLAEAAATPAPYARPEYPADDPIPPWIAHTPEDVKASAGKQPATAPQAMLPTGPGGGRPFTGKTPKTAEEIRQISLDESAGAEYYRDQATATNPEPMMPLKALKPGEHAPALTPEAYARKAAGAPTGFRETFGDLINAATDYTTGAVVNAVQGKSAAQAAGERIRETKGIIESDRAMAAAKQKQAEDKPLTPEDLDLLANDKGAVQELWDGIKAIATNDQGAAGKLALQMAKDFPTMVISGGVFNELMQAGKALKTGANLRKASRSLAYAEKLSKKAAEAKLAKPSAIAEIAKDIPENALAGSEIGYGEAKARGEQYSAARAAGDVATGALFSFLGAPAKVMRAAKDPRPTLKDLRAHPAINEMMPRLQHLLQNPETSDIGFIIRPKEDGTDFWSREDLDKSGYGDREPGYYGAAGAYDPKTGSVTLQKTADASTVMEESIHYLQNKIRTNSAKNAGSPDPQSDIYTVLQNNIDEWEDAVRAEAKRRGVTIPDGDELLGQAMAAHLGYADAYEGTVIPRIVVPDAILEGFNKLLGDTETLRGANPLGEGDIAASSVLPERPPAPEPAKPSTEGALEHAITEGEKQAKSGMRTADAKARMLAESIDLTPKKEPIGSDDPFAGVDDMVVKAPSADPADDILAALEAHNGAKPAAPAASPAPAPEAKPAKGRKAKKHVPEEDLIIPASVFAEKEARSKARHDSPATPDLPARKPAPGTEVESNFIANEAPKETPEVAKILNNAGRRPLPDISPKKDAPPTVMHLGRLVQDALVKNVKGTSVLHVHPEDAKRLGLDTGQASDPRPMSSMAMKRQLGLPVKVDVNAKRLTDIAHGVYENLTERRAMGEPLHMADMDIPESLEFHEDDLADALINRPRRKDQIDQQITEAQGRYRSNEDRMLEEDAAREADAKKSPTADKGYPAEWDDPAPVAGKNDRGEDILFQLVGRKAKNFDRAERRGETFKGKYDGKDRFEIDDSRAKWTPHMQERFKFAPSNGDVRATIPLKRVLDHPELYRNYPQLENIRVDMRIDPKLENPKGSLNRTIIEEGRKREEHRSINVEALDEAQAREFLMHEIQHAIQYEEDFAKGGNWRTGLTGEERARLNAKDISDEEYNTLAAKGRQAYNLLAGEIEARDTQSRSTIPYVTRRKNFEEAVKVLQRVKNATQDFDHITRDWEGSHEQKKVMRLYDRLEDLGYSRKDMAGGGNWHSLAKGMKNRVAPMPYSSEAIPAENAIVRYQLRARKPAETPVAEPHVKEKPETFTNHKAQAKEKVVSFPKKAKPAEGAFIPPAAGDMTRDAGPAPRVDERVENLRSAEAKTGQPPATLSRDVARTWESMDEDVRQMLMTHGMEHFEHILKTRTLSDVEGQAFDAIVQGKRETMQEAQAAYQQAAPGERAAAEAEALAAAGEYTAAQMMQINGLTETARALAAAARRMKGAKSTDAPALVKSLAKTLPDVGPKDLALLLHAWKTSPEQFPDLLRGYANPGKMRKLGEFYRAGLLSWVPTHLRNVAGNTGESLTRFAETPLSGALDAVAQAIYGGKRTRYSGEVAAEVAGMAKAFPGALANLGSGLKSLYRDEPINLAEPLERQIGAIGSGKVGHVEKAVGKFYTRPIFKLLAIEDRFFRDIGGSADTHRLALRKAISEGKEGKAAETRAQAIIGELDGRKHPEIIQEVRRLNDERVFQEDPGQFIRTLSTWANKTPLGFFLPFVRTPANLAKRTLQRTPFGFLKTTAEFKAWRKAVDEGAPAAEISQHRGAAMDLGARAMVGSTILSGFAALAATGLIGMTGGGPNDPKEKKLKMESGWQPYSFKFRVNGEDHWVPYAWWEPVSSVLGMAADIAESNTDEGFDYENAVSGIAGNLVSKSYLSSFLDLAEVIKAVRYGEAGGVGKFASSHAGSWVPAFIGRAAAAMDPIQRDTKPTEKGIAGVGERVKKTIKAKVPGWSETVPPVYGQTGEPVRKKGSGAERWLAPAAVSSESDAAPLVKGLEEAGVNPPAIPETITVEGKGGARVKLTLTEGERAQLAAAQAKTSKLLGKRMQTPFWKSMKVEDQQDEIDAEYKEAHDEALDRIRKDAEKRAREM